MRKFILAATAVAVLSLTVPLTGAASSVSPVSAQAGDGYTPPTPTGPVLAGSLVGGCGDDGAEIDYNVALSDPGSAISDTAVTLALSNGSQSVDVALGDLVDGRLSGSVTWPAAEWTRGDVSAQLRVAPSLSADVSVPTSPTCGQAASALAATGLGAAVWPIGIGGGIIVLAGVFLLALRRRAQH